MLEINVMRRKGRKVKRPAGTGYNYHGGLWGLVVVWLSLLSGWALATQARGVLGSTPGGCQPFHFPLFSPHNIYFQCEARCFEYIHDVSYSIYLDIPAYSWMKALWNNGVISNSVLDSPSWSWSCCMQTCDGYHTATLSSAYWKNASSSRLRSMHCLDSRSLLYRVQIRKYI